MSLINRNLEQHQDILDMEWLGQKGHWMGEKYLSPYANHNKNNFQAIFISNSKKQSKGRKRTYSMCSQWFWVSEKFLISN